MIQWRRSSSFIARRARLHYCRRRFPLLVIVLVSLLICSSPLPPHPISPRDLDPTPSFSLQPTCPASCSKRIQDPIFRSWMPSTAKAARLYSWSALGHQRSEAVVIMSPSKCTNTTRHPRSRMRLLRPQGLKARSASRSSNTRSLPSSITAISKAFYPIRIQPAGPPYPGDEIASFCQTRIAASHSPFKPSNATTRVTDKDTLFKYRDHVLVAITGWVSRAPE